VAIAAIVAPNRQAADVENSELSDRGVAARRDYASVADFRDPDGDVWVLQERGFNGS
jgi:hypothetical protein